MPFETWRDVPPLAMMRFTHIVSPQTIADKYDDLSLNLSLEPTHTLLGQAIPTKQRIAHVFAKMNRAAEKDTTCLGYTLDGKMPRLNLSEQDIAEFEESLRATHLLFASRDEPEREEDHVYIDPDCIKQINLGSRTVEVVLACQKESPRVLVMMSGDAFTQIMQMRGYSLQRFGSSNSYEMVRTRAPGE